MKKLILVGAFLTLLNAESLAQNLPFLFSADEKIVTENILDMRKPSDVLIKNVWLSNPPTRLELIHFIIGQDFKVRFQEFWDSQDKEISKSFVIDKKTHISAIPQTYFSKEHGILLISAEINIFDGKPKKPIKEYCDEVMSFLSYYYSKDSILLPNLFDTFSAGVENPSDLKNIANTIADNLVLSVTVAVYTPKDKESKSNDFFSIRAFKYANEKNIHYSKTSRQLKP